MYSDLETIYNLFKINQFKLYKKEINLNNIKLEFCKLENIIDKFTLIIEKNKVETIIPLKKNNKSYKTINNNLNNIIDYLKLHIEYYNCNI